MNNTCARCALFLTALLLVTACGEQQAEAPTSEAEPAATAPSAESAALPRSAAADGATVFFVSPADGDVVSSPVTIEFGIDGMSVVPAGVNEEHSGHHHLLVDTGLPELGLPIPADASHIHFGDGSTTTGLALEPGEHTLQLLLGDHLHIPHSPPVVSEIITITVE